MEPETIFHVKDGVLMSRFLFTKESKTPMAAGVKISRAALIGSMPPGTSSMDTCFKDLVQMFLDGREFPSPEQCHMSDPRM